MGGSLLSRSLLLGLLVQSKRKKIAHRHRHSQTVRILADVYMLNRLRRDRKTITPHDSRRQTHRHSTVVDDRHHIRQCHRQTTPELLGAHRQALLRLDGRVVGYVDNRVATPEITRITTLRHPHPARLGMPIDHRHPLPHQPHLVPVGPVEPQVVAHGFIWT